VSLGRRAALALPLLALAGTVRAQTQSPGKLALPATWYGVRIDDNAFTVDMPGVPDHRVVNDSSARGTPFQLHSYTLESGGSSYAVQTAVYPADVDVGQPRTILQAALNGRVQQLVGHQWTRTDWRTVSGAPAVDSLGALPGGSVLRQLSLLRARRFVTLAYLGGAAGATGGEAERFFTSLKWSA